MTCQDRDQNLLLYGLGDLSPWERWKVTCHLRSCARCRARQQELAALSAQLAAALRPPSDGGAPPQGPGAPLRPALRLKPVLSPLILALLIGLFTISAVSFLYLRTHKLARPVIQDQGCRPDLPNDKCR